MVCKYATTVSAANLFHAPHKNVESWKKVTKHKERERDREKESIHLPLKNHFTAVGPHDKTIVSLSMASTLSTAKSLQVLMNS